MSASKREPVSLPLLDVFEALFPRGREHGVTKLGMYLVDESDALGGWRQNFLLAFDVARLEKPFDDGGSGGRGPKTAVFHVSLEVVVVEIGAGPFHGVEKRGVVVGSWWLRLTRLERLGAFRIALSFVENRKLLRFVAPLCCSTAWSQPTGQVQRWSSPDP